jgi:hypothetical protein
MLGGVATQQEVILGRTAYMSPERDKGKSFVRSALKAIS